MNYLHLLLYCQYSTAFFLGILGIIPWIYFAGPQDAIVAYERF